MKKVISLLKHIDRIYIFGAQSRAKTLMGYIRELEPSIRILGFLVDDEEQNEGLIDGIPVYHMDSDSEYDVAAPVFLATKGLFHEKIIKKLQKNGFAIICPISVEVDNTLRNAYVAMAFEKQHREFMKIERLSYKEGKDGSFDNVIENKIFARVYVARSIYDKELQTPYTYPSYEKDIQVGAALTARRLKDIECLDCTGDNISIKNRQYCELTGLYWLWKNCHYDIVGLSHYRRHFILPDNWIETMVCENIDVILPVPTYVYPNIDENYRQRHIPEDWDYLLQYLKEMDVNIYKTALETFAGNLYLPCNMFIAKWEVLDNLCSWIFPILDAVVDHGGTKEDIYMNRYAGFISERLITLFFYINEDKYKIAYADRIFLQ